MANPLPQTMKSVHQPSKFSTHLELVRTPLPTLNDPTDVLVKVHATSPCAGELFWARDYAAFIPEDKEPVPCSDLAGTVVSAPSTSSFRPGDAVYARVSADRPGCLREFTLARETELALKPEALSFIESAAVPLSALTAWQGLFLHGGLDKAGLKGDGEARRRNAGVRVLVTGATGGVGSWVVQLAALAGAGAVVALCGPSKGDVARRLGATEVVDYSRTSIAEWAKEDAARECQLVIDCIGGDALVGCWSAVRDGGVLLSIAGLPDAVRPEGVSKSLAKSSWFLVEALGSNLAEIAELIDAGKIRPVVDSVWEFEDFEKAFEKLETGHSTGKIIITVDSPAEEVESRADRRSGNLSAQGHASLA